MVFCEFNGMRIAVPEPQEVEQKFREDNSSPFPFWTRLWPSSYALAQYVEEEQDIFRDRSVIEFGAGIGLPSLVASRTASRVLSTDHDAESVKWMEWNIQMLGLANVRAKQLDWTDYAKEKADIVLLSDVSYDPGCFDVLSRLIHHFIGTGSLLIMAMPERIISSHFLGMIGEHVQFSKTTLVEEKTVIITRLGS
jgi:predicted nicotinamide N-methyase